MINRRNLLQATLAGATLATLPRTGTAGPRAEEARKYKVMKAIIDAWARGDVDAVTAHLSDDIVWHYAAGAAPPLVGIQAARDFLLKFRGSIAEVRWRIFNHAASGNLLFVEGVDEYIGTNGVRAIAPYAGVLAFRDGKIAEWRDYFDRGQLEKTRAGEAAPPFVEELIARPTT
jgi:limonene-1,2-epoxide hydrolase